MNRRGIVVLVGALLALGFVIWSAKSRARDLTPVTWKPQYAQADPAVRAWYEHAQLTPEAALRLGFKSCCAHSDVVHTRFRVNKIDGTDQWQWLDGGQWKTVPPDIVETGQSAPDGQATLFAIGGEMPTCFFPPDGGI